MPKDDCSFCARSNQEYDFAACNHPRTIFICNHCLIDVNAQAALFKKYQKRNVEGDVA